MNKRFRSFLKEKKRREPASFDMPGPFSPEGTFIDVVYEPLVRADMPLARMTAHGELRGYIYLSLDSVETRIKNARTEKRGYTEDMKALRALRRMHRDMGIGRGLEKTGANILAPYPDVCNRSGMKPSGATADFQLTENNHGIG